MKHKEALLLFSGKIRFMWSHPERTMSVGFIYLRHVLPFQQRFVHEPVPFLLRSLTHTDYNYYTVNIMEPDTCIFVYVKVIKKTHQKH